MSSNKAIVGIQKQNDSIYASLVARNISFERIVFPEGITEEEQLQLLNEENLKLKEVVKANKPAPQPKTPQAQSQAQLNQETKPKEKKVSEEGDDDEETFEEPVKKFNTITNMEDMKRAFFSGDYEIFEEQLKAHSFLLYRVKYKYDSDKDGVPDFAAKNLLKGFVRNFDDYRKYFMICFRCWKDQNISQYKYDSLWIVNTTEPIKNIIGSTSDDFEFELETNTGVDSFISDIKKLPESDEPVYTNGFTCIGESYVH